MPYIEQWLYLESARKHSLRKGTAIHQLDILATRLYIVSFSTIFHPRAYTVAFSSNRYKIGTLLSHGTTSRQTLGIIVRALRSIQLIGNVSENPGRKLQKRVKGKEAGKIDEEREKGGGQSEDITRILRSEERKKRNRLEYTAVWYRMEREYPMGGDRGDDLDNDGPEPLATVGQLSSPRFASFFEPPLYIHTQRHTRTRRRGGKRSSSMELFEQQCIYAFSIRFASIYIYDLESFFSIAHRIPHKWFLHLLYKKFLRVYVIAR